MVTKRKAPGRSAGDDNLAKAVRGSAQQIWLAGLGAFSKAQAEGTKVFNALVKEGRMVHAKTRKAAEIKVGEMTTAMGKLAAKASNQASGNWDRLEQVIEKRLARALNSVAVPTNKEIQILAKRMDQLTASVHRLAGRAPRKTAAKKTAAGKPARRKAAK